MRITQSRLIEIASTSVGKARDRTGDAAIQLSSGVRVAKPSDDAAAWATGMATKAAMTMNAMHEKTIDRARDRVTQADAALAEIHGNLLEAHDLAVQLSNDTYSVEDRAQAAGRIRAMREDVLASLNARTVDGEYIFAGDQGDDVAFDDTGTYVGGAASRRVEVGQGSALGVMIDVEHLGSANGGLDLIGALDRFADALEANDSTAINDAVDDFDSLASRVVELRSDSGYHLQALDQARDARDDLELTLKTAFSRQIESDPIAAATQLAQAQAAFDAAGAVAQRIISMLSSGR
ncbi:hypothetical protein L6R52_06200 [Myxococcota bacterium]|nr:hypothetical protein [Myxococcota bacterium]